MSKIKDNETDLRGMTVNERLYVSGLMDDFDKYLKKDKERVKKILRDLYVDESSINEIIK
jgi:hypothetical protein|tara:strand:- start:95 stop:274 length:180 start_codon:yes stop_codon:yes gene_type:complete